MEEENGKNKDVEQVVGQILEGLGNHINICRFLPKSSEKPLNLKG